MSEDYERQAKDFLAKTGTEFKAEFVEYGKHFDDDKENRDIYNITLARGERKFTFRFSQSTNDSGFKLILDSTKKEVRYTWQDEVIKKARNDLKEFRKLASHKMGGEGAVGVLKGFNIKEPITPTPYDVLACLTKSEPGSFEDFCGDFGYDVDSRRAEKTYEAVKKEYDELCKLFNESEMQELAEIN